MRNLHHITTYLKVVGWASVASYPFTIIIQNILFYESFKQFGSSDQILMKTMGATVFGYVLGAPVDLALPVLCLFAAGYLKAKANTFKEIFE